ncbi:MAG: beta-glucosidase BglX [Bacteroidales bacterium]|jgi:beta-glucosidase|nr:beta-glucosidase BglX [Bacteroidales bacterium]
MKKMLKRLLPILIAVALVGCKNQQLKQTEVGSGKFAVNKQVEAKVDSLLSLMTLEEKIGQLNQLSGNGEVTGPISFPAEYMEALRKGLVGSMLNINGAAYTYKVQKVAVEESRLHIPLIFGYDVIHGYKTIFPIPLGEAASWDMEAIEKSARVAAIEASAAGQHWTFAPMVDIARDPRWGRVMEGAGEDPFFGSAVARARVKGFQGSKLSDTSSIAACAKHFVAYGAAQAGRDYNTVDISERTLYEVYLPPFKSALDAGVVTFMSSFNELNGIPVTGNKAMVNDLLKEKWGFNGFVDSDWGSIREMIYHGYAANEYEAGYLAMSSGVDMDLEGRIYLAQLKKLVEDGRITVEQLDEAVRRILRVKFELGLFDNPYKGCDSIREKELLLNPRHLEIAREVTRKSLVLLKNENVLPLSRNIRSIAVVGPLADNQDELIGTWSGRGEGKHVVSVLSGIREKLPNGNIYYAKGCEIVGENKAGFDEAINAARKADAVVVVVGESAMMSGEALSRAFLDLPGVQKDLVMELNALHKPLVVVVMNGRPLTIEWMDKAVPAILEAWLPGTMGGLAIADVLFGDYNPSGKLPMSFPRNVGQIPIFYYQKSTGRPPRQEERYTSKYIDSPVSPLYPFGYGLSYTTFEYSNLSISSPSIKMDETLKVSVDVRNSGKYDGEEVVQLYVRDMVGSVTRPIRELKGFKKIFIKSGESARVEFSLTSNDLAFYNQNMEYIAEPGDFMLFIGGNSDASLGLGFRLEE